MEPTIKATTETVTNKVIRKIDDRNYEVVLQSEKVTPINVDELLATRQRHVDMIAKIDEELSLASVKGVDILTK